MPTADGGEAQPPMSQSHPTHRRLQPATPPAHKRPRPPMPRQAREAPPSRLRTGHTVFGRPWPLPISPAATGLLLLFLIAAGAAWWFEGRYETPPAEAAKLVIPYKADQVQEVRLTTNDGTATYTRGANGKFSTGGPEPSPTPTPGPDATPAPVSLSLATQLESLLNQLHDLKIDRLVTNEPSASAEYGLDKPQFSLAISPKKGSAETLAVGQLNPNKTAYYVRRESHKDTVLVSRYTLDDLIKVASDLIKPPNTATG